MYRQNEDIVLQCIRPFMHCARFIRKYFTGVWGHNIIVTNTKRLLWEHTITPLCGSRCWPIAGNDGPDTGGGQWMWDSKKLYNIKSHYDQNAILITEYIASPVCIATGRISNRYCYYTRPNTENCFLFLLILFSVRHFSLLRYILLEKHTIYVETINLCIYSIYGINALPTKI